MHRSYHVGFITAIIWTATSLGHTHFVIIECRHLAKGCRLKCGCVGWMLFRNLSCLGTIICSINTIGIVLVYMHAPFVTPWLQVMQPLTNVHETKWTPYVKRENDGAQSYTSSGFIHVWQSQESSINSMHSTNNWHDYTCKAVISNDFGIHVCTDVRISQFLAAESRERVFCSAVQSSPTLCSCFYWHSHSAATVCCPNVIIPTLL